MLVLSMLDGYVIYLINLRQQIPSILVSLQVLRYKIQLALKEEFSIVQLDVGNLDMMEVCINHA